MRPMRVEMLGGHGAPRGLTATYEVVFPPVERGSYFDLGANA
jgi:hypothetical protein